VVDLQENLAAAPRERHSGVTSHDVARLAGLSQSTVSRALRDDPRVAAATRERVHAAAATLGYVPNALARNLVLRRTRTIGMLVTDIANAHYPNLIAPLHDELAGLNYRMVLFTERLEGNGDQEHLEPLIDRAIDGAVLTTTTLDSAIPRELTRQGLPFVLLAREVDGVAVDAAVVDNALGGSLVAAEVVRAGHRRIAAIFGPANTSTGRDRERGFRAGLAAAGVELHDEALRRGAYAVEIGFTAMQELMGLDERPTVVACFSDLVAIGAMNAARTLGLDVPGDVSITGWDDLPVAAWEICQLTTVRQSMNEMARTAARLLVDRIEGRTGPEPRRVLFEPELVIRATLARPPDRR
jgi:LacI family transcriptional regulator, galactose operon repressor